MSSLIVEVCRIREVRPHPNADKLDVAVVKGWQCVVPKGAYRDGDLVTYIPPDSVLPVALSDELGVTKYLSKGRVRCAKLRGEPSYGVVCAPRGPEGFDAADLLGITKYEPPIRVSAGDAAPAHPMFPAYTDIENLRNFTDILSPGEPVVYTEKIHGTNCRVGWVREDGGELVRMAGSKGMQRKESDAGTYWLPWRTDPVVSLMTAIAGDPLVRQVVLFGEVYGKVQSLRYGVPNGLAFRAFDLMVDGRYLDFGCFRGLCVAHGIEMVPVLAEEPFSMDRVRELSAGPSVVPGADHIREGVVVKPVRERHSPTVGRVILKYISDDYLCGNHEDAGEAVA